MAETEFPAPDFLKGNSVDEVHRRMLDTLPDGVDKSEGSFPWDFTRPAASEIARMTEFTLTEAMKNAFPQTAEGRMLDLHAALRGVRRRPASKASVTLRLRGVPGTNIPAGFKASTESTLDSPGVVFLLDGDAVIPESGSILVPATAELAGTGGNVAAGCVCLQVKPLRGVQSVANEAGAAGGYEAEDDGSLREKIREYDAFQGLSFVGSPADYKRWAKEVTGVRTVHVVEPSGPDGVIRLVIINQEGRPADEKLCAEVYNHIMRPDSPMDRLAGINARLEVVPPRTIPVSLSAGVSPAVGRTLEMLARAVYDRLLAYFSSLEAGGTIRYSEIGSLLIQTPGVLDYAGLLLNGGTANIPIEEGGLPVTDPASIVLTEIAGGGA